MTHKRSRYHSLSFVAAVVAIVMLSVVFPARAQMPGAGHGSAARESAQQDASGSPQAMQDQPAILGNAERAPAVLSQKTKRATGLMDSNPPLFRPIVTHDSGGRGSSSLTVGDVNGDGHPDVVVTNSSSSSVTVLLGKGDGTFEAPVSYNPGGGNPWSVAIKDVNGDGRPDLVVANYFGGVGVLIGNGDGTFQTPVTYNSGGALLFSVKVADLNGDGKLDMVVAHWCPSSGDCSHGVVGVLLGNGDGTFQPPVIYNSSGYQAYSVAIADVNGDGSSDLVVANNCQSAGHCGIGSVSVLMGNGDGTFQAPVSYSAGGSGTESVLIGDVNGDGHPDLVLANGCPGFEQCTNGGVVSVLLGNGDGIFQAPVSYSSGGLKAFSVAIGDVNGDGYPDLAVANVLSNSVGVLLGNGDGTFQPAITYDSGGIGAYSVALADINGNGRPDLLVANCTGSFCDGGNGEGVLGVLLNNSGGKSVTSTGLASSLNPSIYGQRVTFTATVKTAGSLPPTGRVAFTWGGGLYTIGSATLNGSGVATLTKSNLNADPYPLTAVYRGDVQNLGSTSPVLNQRVLETTSAATITASPNPSTLGQAVTFSAKISSPTVTPTGPVTFTAGKTVLGTVELSSGKAKFTTSSLRAGSTVVTVIYLGDSNIAKSSAAVTEVAHP